MKTSVESSRRSDSAAGSRAPFKRASFAWFWRSVNETSNAVALRRAGERDAGGGLAEADQLRVLPRAWREALRRDVQRLEQVRLADAVRADDEHDTFRELELE